jgi:large subunit ribosomal protein L4
MMELKLIDHTGESTANIAAPDEVFGRAYNEALIHQVVTAYPPTAAAHPHAERPRRGQAFDQKPWRQKGTGRARAA